jgi:hypothetical protein
MIGFRPISGYLSGLTNFKSAHIKAYRSLKVLGATHGLFSMKAYVLIDKILWSRPRSERV